MCECVLTRRDMEAKVSKILYKFYFVLECKSNIIQIRSN